MVKRTVDQFQEISVRKLRPSAGQLITYWYGENVEIVWTPCRFGGEQPWYLCPGCGRRTVVLYRGRHIACRHCLNLAYPSQRIGAGDRALERAEKIRKRLGWRPGIAYGLGARPAGMHYRTYADLVRKHNEFVARWLGSQAKWLEMIRGGPRVQYSRVPLKCNCPCYV